MTAAKNHPNPALTPEDIAKLLFLQRGNEGLRAVLCTLARQGVAFRRANPDRTRLLCEKLAVYPLYKGGQFLFDLMEWEDFMLDGPPPALVSPLTLSTLLAPLSQLFNLFQDYLQRDGNLSPRQEELTRPDIEPHGPEVIPLEAIAALPQLESSFYLYRDVVIGWLGPMEITSADHPPVTPPSKNDTLDDVLDPPKEEDSREEGSKEEGPMIPSNNGPLKPLPEKPDVILSPVSTSTSPKAPAPGQQGWPWGCASALLLSLALGATTWFWVASRNDVQLRIAQAQRHQHSFERYQADILQLMREGLQPISVQSTTPPSRTLQLTARSLTLTVARELRGDSFHRGQLLQFLYQINLINQPQPVIQLGTVQLQAADLVGAKLQGVNLNGADLRRANLDAADLKQAQLQGSNLSNADLNGADLRCANLQRANLQGVDLTDANLAGVRFGGAQLDQGTQNKLQQQQGESVNCNNL